MTRIEEIEKRLKAIESELETDGADLNALSKETDELLEERKGILSAIEKRKSTLKAISEGMLGEGEKVMPQQTEERKMGNECAEYRSAFLKHLRNMEMSDVEKRALTTGMSSAGAAVPTQTAKKIVEKVVEFAPLLDKIDLLAIKGKVTIPAEGTTLEAQLHAEGAVIDGDKDTLKNIDLGVYEITKLVTISKSVETMSIDAFEEYLTNKIARKVAEKITGYIINGTGTNQPEGINAIKWDETNSVMFDGTLTEAQVDSAVALLNGGYDAGAEWLMSKKTFFADYRPIQNKSKNDVVTKDGKTWYIEGYPVNFDDRVQLHDAFLGNLRLGYVGNLPEDVTVTSQFVVRENSYDFLGAALFDGKISAVEAFVKIGKN